MIKLYKVCYHKAFAILGIFAGIVIFFAVMGGWLVMTDHLLSEGEIEYYMETKVLGTMSSIYLKKYSRFTEKFDHINFRIIHESLSNRKVLAGYVFTKHKERSGQSMDVILEDRDYMISRN